MDWSSQLIKRQAALGLTLPKSKIPEIKEDGPLVVSPEQAKADSVKVDSVKESKTDAEVVFNPPAIDHSKSIKNRIIFDSAKNANKNDYHNLEWGRHRDAGFVIGRKFNGAPTFFTADGHTVHLEDSARGSGIIIVGDKLSQLSNDVIKKSNYPTFGYDSTNFMVNFWASLKDPSVINREIFDKPNIIKFLPVAYSTNRDLSGIPISNKPMTFYYRRSDNFSSSILTDDCIYTDHSSESVHLAIIKICYVMGFRKILMAGVNIGDMSVVKKIEDLQNVFSANKLRFHTDGCNFSINPINIANFVSI